jgi:hypothetical protein
MNLYLVSVLWVVEPGVAEEGTGLDDHRVTHRQLVTEHRGVVVRSGLHDSKFLSARLLAAWCSR